VSDILFTTCSYHIYLYVSLLLTYSKRVQVKFQSRGALVNHIKKYHNHVTVKAAEATGNPSMQKIGDARGIRFTTCFKRVPNLLLSVFFSTIIIKHHENAAAKRLEHVQKAPTLLLAPKRRRINKSSRKGKGKKHIKPVNPLVYKLANKKKN
jgi:hypothetical protein